MPRTKARATSMGSGRQSQGKTLGAIPQERLDKYAASARPTGTPRKRRFFVLRYTDEHKFNWYAQTLDPVTELPKQWTTAPQAAITWTTRDEAASMRDRTLANWRETQGMMMPMPKHYPFVCQRIDQDFENETITISTPTKVIDVTPTVVTTRKRRPEKTKGTPGRNSGAAGKRAADPAGRGSDLRGDGPKRNQRKAGKPVADKRAVSKSKKRVGKQPVVTSSKASGKRLRGQVSSKAPARKPVQKPGRTAAKRPRGKTGARVRK